MWPTKPVLALLLDYQMPEKNGFEVIVAVKELFDKQNLRLRMKTGR